MTCSLSTFVTEPVSPSGVKKVLLDVPECTRKVQLSLLVSHMLWLAGAPRPPVKCSVCSRGRELYFEANWGTPFGLAHVEISVQHVSAWDRSQALGGSYIF